MHELEYKSVSIRTKCSYNRCHKAFMLSSNGEWLIRHEAVACLYKWGALVIKHAISKISIKVGKQGCLFEAPLIPRTCGPQEFVIVGI